MAEKKYFWLKLEKDYLTSPKIKKLRKIAGGDTFTIIYLKLLLQSVSTEGMITFEGIEPTFAEELSLKLDEQVEDVQMTLAYLDAQGLLEKSDNTFLLPEASNRIGSESESAERVRRFRERQKTLQCNGGVTDVKQISISNSISKSNSIICDDNKDNNINIESKRFKPPTKEQVLEYARSKNAVALGEKFYEYFVEGDWKDSKGNKVRNWKQKFLTWLGHTSPDKSNFSTGRQYTREEMNSLFQDIDDIEI